jgi:hypothetical protein
MQNPVKQPCKNTELKAVVPGLLQQNTSLDGSIKA